MGSTSRWLFVVLAVAGMLVGSPQRAHAGLWDLIWDISGPQMIGRVFRCRVPVGDGRTRCDPPVGRPAPAPDAPAWFSLEPGFYISLWKDSETDDGTPIEFRAGRTVMAAFDPIVEFRSPLRGRTWFAYHGVGATFQALASADFPRIGKAGYKLRLIGVEWDSGWSAAFNLRLYPDGFGADQFGVGPPVTGDRPFERSWGVIVGTPRF